MSTPKAGPPRWESSGVVEPPRIFLSYAHSTAKHKRRVAELVGVLRESALAVDIDTDVEAPQGPEEGWPKWMKGRLKEATWVLLFFDDVYRRRFEGEEDPSRG